MRNAGGYAVMTNADGSKVERDTITCFHCNRLVTVNSRMDPAQQTAHRVIEAEKCRMCMRHICPVCVGKLECKPFEKKLDAYEARMRLRGLVG